jgi:hypothetical protein
MRYLRFFRLWRKIVAVCRFLLRRVSTFKMPSLFLVLLLLYCTLLTADLPHALPSIERHIIVVHPEQFDSHLDWLLSDLAQDIDYDLNLRTVQIGTQFRAYFIDMVDDFRDILRNRPEVIVVHEDDDFTIQDLELYHGHSVRKERRSLSDNPENLNNIIEYQIQTNAPWVSIMYHWTYIHHRYLFSLVLRT